VSSIITGHLSRSAFRDPAIAPALKPGGRALSTAPE